MTCADPWRTTGKPLFDCTVHSTVHTSHLMVLLRVGSHFRRLPGFLFGPISTAAINSKRAQRFADLSGSRFLGSRRMLDWHQNACSSGLTVENCNNLISASYLLRYSNLQCFTYGNVDCWSHGVADFSLKKPINWLPRVNRQARHCQSDRDATSLGIAWRNGRDDGTNPPSPDSILFWAWLMTGWTFAPRSGARWGEVSPGARLRLLFVLGPIPWQSSLGCDSF
jgi:hypothetical protein